MRPGTNNAHVSEEHIEKLRKLVETGISQEFTYPGNPWIILASLLVVRLVVDIHGTELITPKDLAQKTYSFLLEQNRTFRANLDRQGDDRKKPWKNQDN